MGRLNDLKSAIVYDIETKRGPDEVEGGWDNPAAMGFATAVAYDFADDHYSFYEGSDGMYSLVKMLHDRLAVSFNGIGFDSRVLLGNDRTLSTPALVGHQSLKYFWNEFDILVEYIRARFNIASVYEAEKKLGDKAIHNGAFNLDALGFANLGKHKCGEGSFAPILYRQERFAELYEYNLLDVRLTKDLYTQIVQTGSIKDRDGRIVSIPTA